MDLLGSIRPLVDITNGLVHTKKMTESRVLAQILAYGMEKNEQRP